MRSSTALRISRKSQSVSRIFRPNMNDDEPVVHPADHAAREVVGATDLVALHDVDVGAGLQRRAARARRDRTARHRRCRRPTASWPTRSPRAARRRSRGCARGSRPAAAGCSSGSSFSTCGEPSVEPSSMTMTSPSAPTRSIVTNARFTIERDGRLVVVAREERRDRLDRRVHWSPRHTASISSSVISGKQGNDTHSAAQASASGHGSRT